MGWIKGSDDQHYEQEREELLGRLFPVQSQRLSDTDVQRIAIAVADKLRATGRSLYVDEDQEILDPEVLELIQQRMDEGQ